MKWPFVLLFFLTALPAAAEPVVITNESAGTFYRGFKRLTDSARLVAPLTGRLCRLPPKDLIEKERLMTGPHSRVSVHIYANPAAAEAIAANAPEFPEGTIIVKEKFGRGVAITDIAGMLKRAKGYDPKNGDWEFFFFTPGGEFTTGKLANCIDCHSGGKRDHVFNVWSLGAK
jgi:hypothetical protein